MSTIRLGSGSVIIENPEESLLSGLVRFDHATGTYEKLYVSSKGHPSVVTMPGFAQRVVSLCHEPRVKDDRKPLPDPDYEAILSGLPDFWKPPLRNAVASCGGVVSVPDILGFEAVVVTILKAYPKERLVDRGTPISLIAVHDRETARRLIAALQAELPGREIGRADSDDIIVVPYSALSDTPRHVTGIFIGELFPDENLQERVEDVSALYSAARWGICSTPSGGSIDLDLSVEGLFGPLSASASYADAVKAGIAAPVTVCWMPCPEQPIASTQPNVIEAFAHSENAAFVRLVSEIVSRIPSDRGCVIRTDTVAMAVRLKMRRPDLVVLSHRMKAGERKALLGDAAFSAVRRVVVTDGFHPRMMQHDVLIMATGCGANGIGDILPGRIARRTDDKTYLVDFVHDWDVHNGRLGYLALHDKARRRRYRELGFNQITVDSVRSLPFA